MILRKAQRSTRLPQACQVLEVPAISKPNGHRAAVHDDPIWLLPRSTEPMMLCTVKRDCALRRGDLCTGAQDAWTRDF